MSLGQGVTISARVCDERALFEYETLQFGHGLTVALRQAVTQQCARTPWVLLYIAVSLRVLGAGKRRVVISSYLPRIRAKFLCSSFPADMTRT